MSRLLASAVEDLLRVGVVGFQEVPGQAVGATRGVVELADGRRVFAKLATAPEASDALLGEALLLDVLRRPWVPEVLGVQEGPNPLLVLEDLSAASWPPPWPDDIAPLLAALQQIAASRPPLPLPHLSDSAPGWERLTNLPEPPPLAPEAWLRRYAPALDAAASEVTVEGDHLVHADLGSGNVCWAERGPVLVDWELAGWGNPLLDRATLALELVAEGRPPPPLPHPGGWASLLAGHLAAEAWTPPPPLATAGAQLRSDQQRLARAGLGWAAAELGLPRPG